MMDDVLKKPRGRPPNLRASVKIDEGYGASHESVVDSLSDAQPIRTRPRRSKNRFMEAELLPKPPLLKGYHSTWIGGEPLNEGNIRNMFLRAGYTPITYRDAAEGDRENWPLSVIPAGMTDADIVTINEKKAYKVPLEDYEDHMAEVGHYQPLDYEQDTMTKFKREAPNYKGKDLIAEEDDGFGFGHQNPNLTQGPGKNREPNFRGSVNTAAGRRH